MRFLFFLLFVATSSVAQLNPYLAGNQPVSGSPSPAEMFHTTLGLADAVVRLPKGYRDNALNYPLILFYPGVGTIGSYVDVTIPQAVSCTGTSCSFTYANSGSEDVLRSSVTLYRNGVAMGSINEMGVFVGSGVSAITTNQYQTAGGTLAFTLSTTIGLDNVTITYGYSKLFMEGSPEDFNTGDGPDCDTKAEAVYGQSGIYIAIDKAVSTANLSVATYFDAVITAAKAAYRVDANRIIITGLSAGGLFAEQVLVINDKYPDLAGIYVTSTGYSGTFEWNNYVGIGWYIVHGQADTNASGGLDNALWTNFTASTNLQNIGGDYLNLWGVAHNSPPTGIVFATNGFDRTTAPYDWWLWALKQSKDATQRATLFTQFAESKASAANMTSMEYARQAELLVGDLSSGTTKTDLQTRLSTVKSTNRGGGKWLYIDFGLNTANTSGNWNNINAATTGTATSNLIDDTGTNTGFGYTTVSQYTASASKILQIGSNRGRQRYHGFEYTANDDGLYIQNTTSTGASRFTSVTAGKTFKLRIYGYEPTANYSAQAGLSFTVEGTNQTCFVAHNSVSNYMEYTGTVDVDGVIDIAGVTVAARDCFVQVMELYISP